jgi:hypothetical protein
MVTTKAAAIPIELQDRDFDILRGLFESRVMNGAHVASLYFNSKREAAKKRLQKLKVAGLIGERRRRAYEPSVLHLTGKAFALLRDQGILSEYPPISQASLEKRARVSDLTIHHELEVMDVKAAFHVAVGQEAALSIEEFCTWPLLHQFESFRAGHSIAEVTVKPDGFIRIQEREQDGGLSEHTFFLEVDRSSETQDTLVSRASCYLDYFKSGGFAVRNGAPRSAYKDFPFRVLMVFKNAERRNNTAERLLQSSPPILTQACLTTLDEVTKNPLGNIWLCPVDYREAVRGTPFEVNERNGGWSYKRQSAREVLVEQRVAKFSVLRGHPEPDGK